MASGDTFTWTDGTGATLNLNDGATYIQMAPDGFGQTGIDAIFRQTPFGNNAVWVYSRLQQRTLTLHMWAKTTSWVNQMSARDALLTAFNPLKGMGQLTFQPVGSPIGGPWVLDCVPTKGPDYDARGAKGVARQIDITLVAANPLWRAQSPTVTALTYPPAGVLTLPVTLNATLVTTSYATATVAPSATGANAPTPIVVSITGPAINPIYTSLGGTQTPAPYVRWNGVVPVGSTLTIDHTPTNPQVTLTSSGGTVSSAWSNLDSGSTLFLVAASGLGLSWGNQIGYSQQNVASTTVSISAYARRSGI